MAIPNGIYTVCFKDGDNRTLRIKEGFENRPGSQIAEYLMGQDNDSDYRAFATVEGDRVSVWKRFRASAEAGNNRTVIALNFLVGADEAKQQECGIRYAIKSGNCYRCNRTLTVEDSVMRGLGPVCAEKMGWTPSIPAAQIVVPQPQTAKAMTVAESWSRV